MLERNNAIVCHFPSDINEKEYHIKVFHFSHVIQTIHRPKVIYATKYEIGNNRIDSCI